METKVVDGVRVELTPEEQAEFDARNAAWEAKAGERAAASARKERDQLLGETDWTQLEDTPAATKAKYKPYRQALRDVPQQPDFPTSFVMPTKPV